eukprot:m.85741 g.85741  ORF g.85741 m.85741 type:complete len:340 (+) comp25894_c0_seq1:70-1089(+)
MAGIFAEQDIIRIGLLGAGDISGLHVQGLHKAKHARLVGLWNRPNCPNVPNPAQKAKEYNCKLFNSAEELCASDEIDVVYVLTNMETHRVYAKMAMENGKHVMIEKPVGSSIAELLELTQIAKDNNVLCIPGHNYIHEPQLDRIKDLIESDSLGKITQIFICYNIFHPETVCAKYPAIIRQILTHHSYICLYLLESLGNPVTVSAMTATINNGSIDRDNLANVMIQWPTGPIGILQASFANDDHSTAPFSFVVKVMGIKGACHYNYNDFVVNAPHSVHSHTYASYPYTVENESEYLTNHILRQGLKPKSTMDDAVTCQKIIEASEKSVAERRHVDLSEI